MKTLKIFGWLTLNIQVLIGLIFSYHYLHRHIIIDNFLLFLILVLIFSNIFFGCLKFIKIYSLRAFISIVISAFCFVLIIVKFNRLEVEFNMDDLLLIFLYIIIRLLLYITTPVFLLFEIFLRHRLKTELRT